jgi:hypothetical protein
MLMNAFAQTSAKGRWVFESIASSIRKPIRQRRSRSGEGGRGWQIHE